MLTPLELFTLARDLSHRKVLSVYLDNRATDPAHRDAWRTALLAAVRKAREAIAEPGDRLEFDRAAARLGDAFPAPGGMWAAPGWVAFATPDEQIFVSELPRRVETLVAWREGPLIIPLLRTLKRPSLVIVAIVQPRAAQLYRYSSGAVEMLEELRAAPDDSSVRERRRLNARRAARGVRAPRSAVDTDLARRRQLTEFQRLARGLAPRLTLLAGTEGVVLISGAPESRRIAAEALPKRLHGRVLLMPDLGQVPSATAIATAAKRAARDVESREGRTLVSRMLRQVGNRSVAGLPSLQRALHLKAVDALIVTPRFLQNEGEWAEGIIQAALAQRADVEVVSGDAGTLLDRVGDGVAARLRFAIDGPATSPRQPMGGGRHVAEHV